FDHGMPRADGTFPPEQRPEADVNIEFQSSAKFAAEAEQLAWTFERANEKYATDYPASVGSHMTNTDSAPFQDYVPAISLRENERGTQIGAGWDPNWHQPTDLYATYGDKDFRLGLNAAQTTLAALAGLAGAPAPGPGARDDGRRRAPRAHARGTGLQRLRRRHAGWDSGPPPQAARVRASERLRGGPLHRVRHATRLPRGRADLLR